jgi:hypothetical protein
MANRNFKNHIYSYQQDIVFADGTFAVGAVGAVGATVGNMTVTRTGVGAYSVVIDDKFSRFIMGDFKVRNATVSGVVAIEVTNDPSVAVLAGTAVTIQCYDKTGAAVDPANGATVAAFFVLRNSSVKGKGE